MFVDYDSVSKNVPRALTIAGSDSGGGAGIQADLKTFTALKVFGMSAITSVTAQNTESVLGINDLAPDFVGIQIDAVAKDLGVDATKIGMLSNQAIVNVVAEKISEHKLTNIVLDPVMVSSTGQPLLDGCQREIPSLLLSHCTVLTPNIPELEQLNDAQGKCQQDALFAAEMLLERYQGLRLVLVKGGHAIKDAEIVDTLVFRTGDAFRSVSASHPRVKTQNTHGTGCTLAAAFTSFHCLCGDSIGETNV